MTHALRSGGKRYDGLVLDGIRFPSFTEELTTFLTCFCPKCAREANDHGVNLRRVQDAIPLILNELRNQTDADLLVREFLDNPDLHDLWRLRALIITNAVRKLRKVMQATSLKSRLGPFLFSPSLASFVGQDYEALGEYLDLVSPMMYASGAGAACLNTEIISLVRALIKLNRKIPAGEILEASYRKLGIPGEALLPRTIGQLQRNGIPPQIIKSETQASSSMLGKGSTLVPSLMLTSQVAPVRMESEYAKEAKTDGVSFFQYSLRHMKALEVTTKP
jgi:hypothetical protein